jgi:hypothetical protein
MTTKASMNFRFMVPCIVFYVYTHTKCPTRCNTSILILLQDHSTCFGHFLYLSSGVLTQLQWCDQPPDLGQFLKPTLPQGSRVNVTSVVPAVVNCSYCTPDDGYGKCPKHVEWSCNKIKILVLHLVGHFVCIYKGFHLSSCCRIPLSPFRPVSINTKHLSLAIYPLHTEL